MFLSQCYFRELIKVGVCIKMYIYDTSDDDSKLVFSSFMINIDQL